MATRENTINRAETYFDNGSFLTSLTRLVAVEAESQNPQKRDQLYRYLQK